MRTRVPRTTVFLVALVGGLVASHTAEAKGTYFMVELNTGVGQSAYVGQDPGLTFGASAGLTVRIPTTPVRYYLLASAQSRGAAATGDHLGTAFALQRADLDLFAANRFVFPLVSVFRIYGEVGIGTRLVETELDRAGFDRLSERQARFLLVTAVGLQARVTRHLSLGVRGEMVPLGGQPDLAGFAADVAPNAQRFSGQLQLGVHF